MQPSPSRPLQIDAPTSAVCMFIRVCPGREVHGEGGEARGGDGGRLADTDVSIVVTLCRCQSLADVEGAVAWTWHDSEVPRGYALACIVRLDGVWAPVGKSHHISGFKTAGHPPVPPQPTPTPTPPVPPCSLNGILVRDAAAGTAPTCICDAGWFGPNCGQLNLLAAPPLAEQVTSTAATSSDNTVANSTWGISVVGPLLGLYHGYMTEIANECLLGSCTFSVPTHLFSPARAVCADLDAPCGCHIPSVLRMGLCMSLHVDAYRGRGVTQPCALCAQTASRAKWYT